VKVLEGGCSIGWINVLARCIDVRLNASSLDLVLHSVEEELPAQEVEQFSLNTRRDVWLEVKKVEIRLVIDPLAFACWHF